MSFTVCFLMIFLYLHVLGCALRGGVPPRFSVSLRFYFKSFQICSSNFKRYQTISRQFQTISRPSQTISIHFSPRGYPVGYPMGHPIYKTKNYMKTKYVFKDNSIYIIIHTYIYAKYKHKINNSTNKTYKQITQNMNQQ